MSSQSKELLWPHVGVHYGIAPELYHSTIEINGYRPVSKSLLWDFFPNPRRWKSAPPKEPTPAMRWGSLIDCLALTPDLFDQQYDIAPPIYHAPESAKKDAPMVEKPWNWNASYCKEWRDARKGMEILTADESGDAYAAINMLFERPEVASMMANAKTQVALRFDLPESLTGVEGLTLPCKALLDIVPDRQGEWGDSLADLKTTGKLDDMRQLEKTIYERGYHVQAALYLDLYNALTGEGRTEWLLVFQLASEPFEVAVVRLSTEAIANGRNWYLTAIRKWARCVTTDVWPSPFDGVIEASLPAWAEKSC